MANNVRIRGMRITAVLEGSKNALQNSESLDSSEVSLNNLNLNNQQTFKYR